MAIWVPKRDTRSLDVSSYHLGFNATPGESKPASS